MELLENGEWRNVLQEYVIYGMLFKAIMADLPAVEAASTKLRYRSVFEKLSFKTESLHHHYRREFGKLGGKILSQGKEGLSYIVKVRVKGVYQEATYWSDFLRAECEVRLNKLVDHTS